MENRGRGGVRNLSRKRKKRNAKTVTNFVYGRERHVGKRKGT